MKTELLAPAKDKEIAIEAINCGADAVYIGASSFGARQNASNSIDDIEEVVKYAHKFYAKVFVTVNTILTDSELAEAVNLVKNLRL
jgi:putative protease